MQRSAFQTVVTWLKVGGLTFATLASLSVFNFAYADTQTRASAFEYDVTTGLLTKEIIEPDDPNLCLVTTYTYDTFGNKTSATTRNCNGSAGTHPGVNSEAAAPAANSVAVITSRTTTTTYDSKGQFPISTTNAIGQTETKTYNANFGTVATLTGPNNLTTSWTYDSFGRPLTENRADGTSTSTAYALCDASCLDGGAIAKYTVTTTQAGAPYSIVSYDMYGRKIQTQTQDIHGAAVLSRVNYDNQGRPYQTSQVFKSNTTILWTTVEFDKLDRPVKVTLPDGNISTTTYNGYTTTTTNAKGQTKTEVKNSQGQLVTVTDTQAKSLTYQYDPFGNLVKTTDALNNVTILAYDKRGRKTAMDDPDQGVWTYQYDALGQLAKQTDAKFQTVSFAYDKLGRMTQRSEPNSLSNGVLVDGLVSTWEYDTCDATLNPAGKCVGKVTKEISSTNYTRTYLYDSLGRATAELDNVDQGYGVTKSFDSYGRVATIAYPGADGISFSTQNVYSTSGFLKEVRETGTNKLLWQAGTTDNAGRLTQQIYGNGITNTTTYDPLTGRIVQVKAGTNDSISNQSFVYDSIGNLTQRYDAVTNLNESFGYDSLNRLTSTSAQAGTGPLTQTTVTYNAIGNILTKSDVGTYTYASAKANGQIRPHAVSNITMNDGTTTYANYTYDANGNVLTTQDSAGKGRTMVWNSWNMPTQITGNKPATSNTSILSTTPINTTSSSFQFVYNASHERVKETLPDGTTVWNVSPRVDTGIHVEKRQKLNGEISYHYSLYAGNMPFGVRIYTKATATSTTVTSKENYYHTDHLGSIIAITDQTGAVVERRSFDAWGKRRNQNGTAMTNAFITSEVRHAFTGHEDLGELGLIHMNGRLYDPAIGRFLSADPTIQYADDMQNYNRYSYINNNPLSATDPSGYGFFSSIFKGIKKLFKNKVFRIAVSMYAGYLTGGMAWDSIIMSSTTPSLGVAAVVKGVVGGFTTGFLASGGDFKAGVNGAISGGLAGFAGEVGEVFGQYGGAHYAAHALAGCVGAEMNGGQCGQGALSGVAGKFGTYASENYGFAVSTIAAGTVSAISGGKFGNGAMTAAFGIMYNCGPACLQHLARLGQSALYNLQSLWLRFGPQSTALAAELGGVNGTLSSGMMAENVFSQVLKNGKPVYENGVLRQYILKDGDMALLVRRDFGEFSHGSGDHWNLQVMQGKAELSNIHIYVDKLGVPQYAIDPKGVWNGGKVEYFIPK